MTAKQGDLRGVLLALKEDIDDEASWAALLDLARERGESWPDAFPLDFGQKVRAAYLSCVALVVSAHAASQIEAVGFHEHGYAEPGYGGPECNVIATGDWNPVKWCHVRPYGPEEAPDDSPELLGDLLDKLGVPCEWEDEWAACGECGKLVRTSPDSHSWVPHYSIAEADIVCRGCRPAQEAEGPAGEGEAQPLPPNACMCNDDGCPACHGYCNRLAFTTVYRIDTDDDGGSPMCLGCAWEAVHSDLFTHERPEEDDESEEDDEAEGEAEPRFDRFDIVEAHYCYYADWHGGQASEEYQRLSRMTRYFKPRPDLSYETLEENGKAIYDALVAKHQRKEIP